MTEPSRSRVATTRSAGSSPRIGRVGLLAWLVVPVLVLSGLTQWQVHQVDQGSAGAADPSADVVPLARLSFGSVTRGGAILFTVAQPVHVRSMAADGLVQWQRDLSDGDYVTCGPCPAAVIARPDGSSRTVAGDGTEGPAPALLGDHLVATTSLVGVVLAAGRADGSVDFYTPTSAGLVPDGSASDAGLDRVLVVVTAADRGGAVTIMRTSADPLRQGEFEVEHVTPTGTHTATVPLDATGSRPRPCAVADAEIVAYVQLDPGPTADGTTHVVADRDGHRLVDARVPGTFDSCAVGPDGAVLSTTANGADGDLTRTRVDVAWVDLGGAVRATATEQVVATSASVALDAATGRVAIAGGPGPAVVVDPSARHERPSALAAAFDDTGGIWWAQSESHVTREDP